MIEPLIKIAILLGGLMTAAAYLVLLERWMAAWIQDRKGPNRVGIPLTKIRLFGLGQPLADGVKFIMKEEHTPRHVDKWLFTLAPISILAAALSIFAVVPFGHMLPAVAGADHEIPLVVAPNIDVGLIYIFALSSIAVYGVILGGWASNNKYSLLGGLRSSAQLIAYELPLGLGILGVILFCGSLRLESIIDQQASTGLWNCFVQPLGFVVFLVASFAEAARLPFDLPEAEQELIGGYHTEYAGLRLLMYLVAEFLHMIVASFLIAILFLGGWHLWGITGDAGEPVTWATAIVRVLVLSAKVMGVILFFMVTRWSWPRFRFDQLMSLAWKVMLPLGMINLLAIAVVVEFDWNAATNHLARPLVAVAVMWGVAVVAAALAGWFTPLATDNTPRTDLVDDYRREFVPEVKRVRTS